MECNKDEALRAKEIAEKKFATKDLAGAKKFAMKAQSLFPSLEGIGRMIVTLDVHLASEVKIDGEKDWYGILCINASADEDTLKKQYRKLALQLHPDKNKSIGAEGAFKVISEAWSVLSDKVKRMAYDQRRNLKRCQQMPAQPKKDQPVHKTTNGSGKSTKTAACNAGIPKSTTGATQPAACHAGIPKNTTGTTQPATCHAGIPKSTTGAKQPAACRAGIPKSTTGAKQPASAAPGSTPQAKLNTFWTSCNQCKIQYQYLGVHANQALQCPKCCDPLVAIEKGELTSGPQQHQQNYNPNTSGNDAFVQGNKSSYSGSNDWVPFSRTTGAASTNASSAAAERAAKVHQAHEKIRKNSEEAQAAVKREEAIQRKNIGSNRSTSGSANSGAVPSRNVPDQERANRHAKKRKGTEDVNGSYNGGSEFKKMATDPNWVRVVFGDSCKDRAPARHFNTVREVLQMDFQNKLLEKAKVTIREKLEEWRSAAAAAAKSAENEREKKRQKQKENAEEKSNDAGHGIATDAGQGTGSSQNVFYDSVNSIKHVPNDKDSADGHRTDLDEEVPETGLIDVPDPDFHDFDQYRSESCFEGNQIWATYDDEDGMPRYYVLVQKVLSLKPFKIRMSFLTSRSTAEFGTLDWVASGFAKTCGNFKVGRYVVKDTINMFSHRVKWEKVNGTIKIFPRRGDIWALYKNWSPDWDEHTPDEVMYEYDMVEVLDDYDEEHGLTVVPLFKLAGFKTVFQRHMDLKEMKRIPREEMFRLSHQVPFHVLTGEEAHNAPKGCLELDPASTPSELLQVIAETKGDVVMEAAQEQCV